MCLYQAAPSVNFGSVGNFGVWSVPQDETSSCVWLQVVRRIENLYVLLLCVGHLARGKPNSNPQIPSAPCLPQQTLIPAHAEHDCMLW